MKLFKWTHDFRWIEKLTGLRVVIMLSTYEHGYKRGEKRGVAVVAEQTRLIFPENQEVEAV
jgi:hypothetical protein